MGPPVGGTGAVRGRVPFTGSHPAAILPFLWTPLPASALVIGSVAPDIPYYLPEQAFWETHDALAVVTTDLLIGVAVWLLWHGLVAAPALAAAPSPLRARIAGRVPVGLRGRLRTWRVLLVPVAVVVGAATHVLWDEFTHAGGWGTAHLGALRATVVGQPGFTWAQYASGVLGAVALLWWVRRWWVRTEPAPVPAPVALWVWPALLAVAAVAGVLAAFAAPDAQAAAFAGATRGGAAAAVVGLALAVGWHVRGGMSARRRTLTRLRTRRSPAVVRLRRPGGKG